jgi:ribosome maturation factor RimP
VRKHKRARKKANKPATPGDGLLSPETLSAVTKLAASVCEAEDLELVHVEFLREASGRVLRVFIEKPGGVQLDDCVHISRQLSDLLDVYFEVDIAYNLEVSSPGIERPLSKLEDFDRFRGRSIRLKTVRALNGRKNFKGELLGIDAQYINLLIDGERIAIPYPDIAKAHLVYDDGEN